MITIRRGGAWGDIFSNRTGFMNLVYPVGNDVKVETVSRVGESLEIKTIHFPEPVLYVRAAANNGSILVCGQAANSGKFLIGGIGVSIPDPKLVTYGTHPCDVIFDGNFFRFVCQVSTVNYYDSFDQAFHTIPVPGTSQGIIQILQSGPQWSDLVRTMIPGMLYPYEMPNLFIGEGAGDPPHIECLDGPENINIFVGHAERPRAACIDNNLLGIASRDSQGTFFLLYERPYPNYYIPPVEPPIEPPVEPPVEPPIDPEEPDDMPCTPVVPPQDVIKRSTDSIRQFCQSYVAPDNALPEYAGRKPYEADEIHENGLFLSDGLLYFMMSDTGNWAKTLMNPDDKRDWESKRVSADNALFNYMKERVGDKPAQSSPGGAIAGDVNVG